MESDLELCRELTAFLSEELKKARAEIEALTLDVHILSEELIRERQPKQDIR
jgi:hypothetical protein